MNVVENGDRVIVAFDPTPENVNIVDTPQPSKGDVPLDSELTTKLEVSNC